MYHFIYSRRKSLLFIPIGLLLLLLSFLSQKINKPSSVEIHPTKPDWLSSWLVMPACEQPCWNNIIPGVTHFDKAVEVVRNLPDVDGLYQETGPLDKNQKALYLHFESTSDRGEIYSDHNGEIVTTITLSIKNYLTIEEIISRFGTPDEITLYACSTHNGLICESRLLYLDFGLAFKFSAVPIDKNYNDPNFSIKVLPEYKVTELFFFVPGIDGYVQSTNNRQGDPLDRTWKWNGYGEYFYP